jgi:YesN/AraC family two-component response regulator
MPEMDGLTLLTKLNELYPIIKAVIISAYGDIENIRTAMNRGAFDFLTKPINFQDLEITTNKTLEHVLRMKAAHEQERLAQQAQAELLTRLQQEVTERQRAEEALRESERRLAQFWKLCQWVYLLLMLTLNPTTLIKRQSRYSAKELNLERQLHN